jgi:hypothetical protein
LTGTLHDPWFWSTMILGGALWLIAGAMWKLFGVKIEREPPPPQGSPNRPPYNAGVPEMIREAEQALAKDKDIDIQVEVRRDKVHMLLSSSATSLMCRPKTARRLAGQLIEHANKIEPPPEPEAKRLTSWELLNQDSDD